MGGGKILRSKKPEFGGKPKTLELTRGKNSWTVGKWAKGGGIPPKKKSKNNETSTKSVEGV